MAVCHGRHLGLTTTIAVIGIAVSSVAGYYAGLFKMEGAIAQVREQYATKSELEKKTGDLAGELKEIRKDLGDVKMGQAAQGQMLQDIHDRLVGPSPGRGRVTPAPLQPPPSDRPPR